MLALYTTIGDSESPLTIELPARRTVNFPRRRRRAPRAPYLCRAPARSPPDPPAQEHVHRKRTSEVERAKGTRAYTAAPCLLVEDGHEVLSRPSGCRAGRAGMRRQGRREGRCEDEKPRR